MMMETNNVRIVKASILINFSTSTLYHISLRCSN